MKRIFGFLPIAALVLLTACGPKDSEIQEKVTTSLAATPGVTAAVKDGVVTLSGEVMDDAAKKAAETAAAAVKGVKSVSNSLTVKPAPVIAAPAISADDLLSKGVGDAIKDFQGVNAGVKDGVISLTGTISADKWKHLKMILDGLNPKKVDAKGLSIK